MKSLGPFFCMLLLPVLLQAQPYCVDPAFDAKVRSYLKQTVPIIDVSTLAGMMEDVVILDARELEEYEISHIPGAIHIGFQDINTSILKGVPRDASIVVYCSMGYRSEIIGETLKSMGYPDVKNLFGSIFEWVNRKHPLKNSADHQTNVLHAYSKNWSKWITNTAIKLVW